LKRVVPLTIRPARPDEAEILTGIAFHAKQSNGYDEAFMAQCVDELWVDPEHIRAGDVWLAEDGEGVAGFCRIGVADEPETAEVESIFVAPDRQGQGVGKALWARLRDEALKRGFTHFALDADPFATVFYEAMGCVRIGESPSGSIPGRMLPRYRCAIAD
jgi:GNAT superfamily N-acetyltransferase